MAGTKKREEGAAVGKTEQMFCKEQIAESAKYKNRKDLVNALLDGNKKYTMEQVDKLIEEFMKGKVK